MPDLSRRIDVSELMDDFSITDTRLERALYELRGVNEYLGGLRAVKKELAPLVRRRFGGFLRILDVGTGIGDIPERLVTWGEQRGVRIDVTAIDANPATVEYARRSLDARLEAKLRERIEVRRADVLELDHRTAEYDVATASLFLHHFDDRRAVRVLRAMSRAASIGLIVNDLHRHRLAYAGIKAIASLMPVSPMFVHDGPASVRRGFKPRELHQLAERAGLSNARIRRRWAYRLVLSTIPETPS